MRERVHVFRLLFFNSHGAPENRGRSIARKCGRLKNPSNTRQVRFERYREDIHGRDTVVKLVHLQVEGRISASQARPITVVLGHFQRPSTAANETRCMRGCSGGTAANAENLPDSSASDRDPLTNHACWFWSRAPAVAWLQVAPKHWRRMMALVPIDVSACAHGWSLANFSAFAT